MSCGQIALDQLNIPVETYYASEIDKWAIQITQKNYPDTVQLGDITKWREWDIDWKSIDLVFGGSPCQGFSFAGKQLAFDDPRSKLFFVFVDILNHIREVNPNVKFLLENVRMKKEYLDVITEYMGVQPVMINSALLSAQNRVRYYWTNIADIKQPEDRGILLSDVLETDVDEAYQYRRTYYRKNVSGKSPTLTENMGTGGNNVPYVRTKSKTIRVGGVASPPASRQNWDSVYINGLTYRRYTPVDCERLQTVPDNYTEGVSNTQRYRMLGNGWTVEVIKHIFKELTPQPTTLKEEK